MKTRNGFVSNSSSTSFCIYGICEPISEIFKNIPKDVLYEKLSTEFELDTKITNEEELETLMDDLGSSEIIECLISPSNGLRYYTPDYDDDVYIGVSWKSIKDDETGAQFKERVKKLIEEKFGEQTDFSTYEEAWMG